MPSAGDATSSTEIPPKKRRLNKVEKACDICRQKKIRCDGGAADAGSRCSYCVAHSTDCTYKAARKRPGRPNRYIEGLEERMGKLEHIIRKIRPDIDLERELELLDTADAPHAYVERKQARPLIPAADSHWLAVGPFDADTDSIASSEDELSQDTLELIKEMRKLEIQPDKTGFYGKSSKMHLMHSATRAKSEFAGVQDLSTTVDDLKRRLMSRKEFWNPFPFEAMGPPGEQPADPDLRFPEPSICGDLIARFFVHINPFFPVLHEPTFRGAYAAGLHHRERGFGCLVLLVCAVAAPYADDPHDETAWGYLQEVRLARRILPRVATLVDMQIYALAVLFLKGSSQLNLCWTLIGHGLRLGIDMGVHRRKVYQSKPTVEDELWKRAFWVLILLDRQLSVALGRPFVIYEEDMDVDFPVECDDEYWETPEHEFEQPAGKPCRISFFICMLKAYQILAFAVRTIYSIHKTKARMGFIGVEWEARTVAQLDSAMNKWKDSLPDHLHWDPHRQDAILFAQSTILQVEFSFIQIMIHRPFMTARNRASPLAPTSSCICGNAARLCAHVVAAHHSRYPFEPLPHTLSPVYISAIILLMTVWNSKKAPPGTEPTAPARSAEVFPSRSAEALHCVNTLVNALGVWEPRHPLAGRLRAALRGLMDMSDIGEEEQRTAQEDAADTGTEYSTPSTLIDTTSDAPVFPSVDMNFAPIPLVPMEQASSAYQPVPSWPTTSQPSMAVPQGNSNVGSSEDFLQFQLNSLLFGNNSDGAGNATMNVGGDANHSQPPDDTSLIGLLNDDTWALWSMPPEGFLTTAWSAAPGQTVHGSNLPTQSEENPSSLV